MLMTRSLRGAMSLIVLAILLILAVAHLGGCSEDDGSPVAADPNQAPTLPDPATLEFDFSFFDAGAGLDKTVGIHDNFINAYLRVAVIGAVSRLVLTPPVAAFAIALHTVPMPQADGSWIWTYEWRDGDERALISLRGLSVAERVEWTMYITLLDDGHDIDDALWFEGSTSAGGQEGRWFFHDVEDPAEPVCGEIVWGQDETGKFLQFVSHEPETDGDTLSYTDAAPAYAIDFTPGQGAQTWFIRWHDDGHGSLRVPDYNDGEEACWDVLQRDTDCR